MISLIQKLPVGNAVRVFLSPPQGATSWRLLRRTADTFTGQGDTGAFLVHEGTDNVVLDTTGLANGVEYFYKAYSYNGLAWTAGDTVSVTPDTIAVREGPDPQTLVSDRLDLWIKAEVARSALVPAQRAGKILVMTAPPQFEQAAFPVVTVRLLSRAPGERSLGEEFRPDVELVTDGWDEAEGWLDRVELEITGFSLNPDGRIALRKSLLAGVQANLPVFDDAGMVQIEFSQQDQEDFTSFPAPVYMTVGQFRCLAPALVKGVVDEIHDVTVTNNAY